MSLRHKLKRLFIRDQEVTAREMKCGKKVTKADMARWKKEYDADAVKEGIKPRGNQIKLKKIKLPRFKKKGSGRLRYSNEGDFIGDNFFFK